jgi:hypothetical protein
MKKKFKEGKMSYEELKKKSNLLKKIFLTEIQVHT